MRPCCCVPCWSERWPARCIWRCRWRMHFGPQSWCWSWAVGRREFKITKHGMSTRLRHGKQLLKSLLMFLMNVTLVIVLSSFLNICWGTKLKVFWNETEWRIQALVNKLHLDELSNLGFKRITSLNQVCKKDCVSDGTEHKVRLTACGGD